MNLRKLLVCGLVHLAFASELVGRAPPRCPHQDAQPLLNTFSRKFPSKAVSSFCSAVVDKKNYPKTTVTSYDFVYTTSTFTDTVTHTFTQCVTSLVNRAVQAYPTPAPSLKRDSKGGALGFPAPIMTKACKCFLPTITATVTTTETRTQYDFVDIIRTEVNTVTVTKPLPTFVAKISNSESPVHNQYLLSKKISDENGNFFAKALNPAASRNEATVFSLTCEGYLLQQNTSSLGPQRLIANDVYAISLAPIYVDTDEEVDENSQGLIPLKCKVNAGKLLCANGVLPEKNLVQFCTLYGEAFQAPITLGDEQGPQCWILDLIVEPVT